MPLGQTVDDKSVFSDNNVCSLYRPGQFRRMFLRPVNAYQNCSVNLLSRLRTTFPFYAEPR